MRELILARRQFFIASALAGVAIGCSDKKPHVCLDMAQPAPTGSTSAAQPCLDVPPPTPPQQPQVCLSERPPDPEPRVCLDVPPPEPTVCLEIAPQKR